MSYRKQLTIGALANLGAIVSGITLGFSAVALPAMQSDDHVPKVDDNQASWIASMITISMPVGCLLIGPLLDGLGRKRTLLLVNMPSILGWLLIATASHDETWFFVQVYAGRLFTGFSGVMASATAAVYVIEVADKKLRGVLSTWPVIAVSLGILLVYVLGSIFPVNWRLVAYICTCVPVLSTTLVWTLIPESPVWLVAKGHAQEAERCMRNIRGVTTEDGFPDNLQQELEAMITRNAQHNKKNTWRDTLARIKEPDVYKPLLIFNAFYFFQTFSGIFVVIFYTVSIVQEMSEGFDGYLATILVGASRLTGSIIVSFAFRWYGRRLMANISGVGITLSLGAIAVFLSVETGQVPSWLKITVLVVYVLTCTVGFLTLPFSMVGEVLPDDVRGSATGFLTLIWCICNFLSAKVFPEMRSHWGLSNVFIFYTVVAFVGFVFLYKYLPETQGKTTEEISEYFRSGGKKSVDDSDVERTVESKIQNGGDIK